MPHSARKHRPLGDRPRPEARPTANARGYTYRWQQYAAAFLARHPLCVQCLAAGRTQAAGAVDHIVPHRGNERRFWDERNHQALCASCHGAKSARERLS